MIACDADGRTHDIDTIARGAYRVAHESDATARDIVGAARLAAAATESPKGRPFGLPSRPRVCRIRARLCRECDAP